MATIDPDGFLQITDRTKDVIKSGGEWISSIDVENIAMGHPAVARPPCIAVPHPQVGGAAAAAWWCEAAERPTRDELLGYLEGKVAKWWIPDDVVFVDELPHTATGKVQKLKLREQYRDHALPEATN